MKRNVHIALDAERVKALGHGGSLALIAADAGLSMDTLRRSLDRGFCLWPTADKLSKHYKVPITSLVPDNEYLDVFAVEFSEITAFLRERFPREISHIYISKA